MGGLFAVKEHSALSIQPARGGIWRRMYMAIREHSNGRTLSFFRSLISHSLYVRFGLLANAER